MNHSVQEGAKNVLRGRAGGGVESYKNHVLGVMEYCCPG